MSVCGIPKYCILEYSLTRTFVASDVCISMGIIMPLLCEELFANTSGRMRVWRSCGVQLTNLMRPLPAEINLEQNAPFFST